MNFILLVQAMSLQYRVVFCIILTIVPVVVWNLNGITKLK